MIHVSNRVGVLTGHEVKRHELEDGVDRAVDELTKMKAADPTQKRYFTLRVSPRPGFHQQDLDDVIARVRESLPEGFEIKDVKPRPSALAEYSRPDFGQRVFYVIG